MSVCDKHRRNPARVYHQCIGCELDGYREKIESLSAALDVMKQNYVYACESIRNKDQMIADRDAKITADEARLKFLAGCGSDCGPVIEGFGNVLDDYWNFLGDAIRERIGEENDTPDEEGTDEDRLKAIRALIDEAMKNEKVVRS